MLFDPASRIRSSRGSVVIVGFVCGPRSCETSPSGPVIAAAPPLSTSTASAAARAGRARVATDLARLGCERRRDVQSGAERDLQEHARLWACEIAREERSRLLEVAPATAPVDRLDAAGCATRAHDDGNALRGRLAHRLDHLLLR